MHKLGLKLWSTNTDYYKDEALKLFERGVFDYIELYVVPDSTEHICHWQGLGIPFSLHAPQFMHGVNLADSSLFENNKKIYEQVAKFYSSLNAKYVVVHSGTNGSKNESIKQINALKAIFDLKIAVENKPYLSIAKSEQNSNVCRGASTDEIGDILDATGCDFCLDVGHAVCSANYFGFEPYGYILDFARFNPISYHFSDNFIDSTADRHEHFGNGNFDFYKILSGIKSPTNIAIETKKNSKTELNDFELDAKFLKGLMCK